jgi:hypothetical protein
MKKLTKDSRIMSVDEKGYGGLLTGVWWVFGQIACVKCASVTAPSQLRMDWKIFTKGGNQEIKKLKGKEKNWESGNSPKRVF